jgi:hypothetical protein
LHDAEFVREFNIQAKDFDENQGLQIMHAARVIGVLKELDQPTLRKLALRCFPKYKRQFPRLVSLKGVAQREQFLRALDLYLGEDAVYAPEENRFF